MKLREVISVLENTFDMGQAEDFDNVGLLCGNPERDINGVLVSHDALENVIDEAVQKGKNLIVCFHPIIFSGLKSITGKNYVERAVMSAVENKIAIYAIHTAWDNDLHGVNHEICKQLGLENQKILMPKKHNILQLEVFVPPDHAEKLTDALFDAGAGHIGNYDECSFTLSGQGSFRPLPGADPFSGDICKREVDSEKLVAVIFENFKKNTVLAAMKKAHPYEEVAYKLYQLENENQYAGLGMYGEFAEAMEEDNFLNFIKGKFNLKMIRHSKRLNKKIKRVGVLGGSGASGINSAVRMKCDAYLTGDLKYHDFFSAEEKILLCDVGHFESEQWVQQQLVKILSEKFPKFAVSKSETNTNPVNYFI